MFHILTPSLLMSGKFVIIKENKQYQQWSPSLFYKLDTQLLMELIINIKLCKKMFWLIFLI